MAANNRGPRVRPLERTRGQGYSVTTWQRQALVDLARADGVRPSRLVRAAIAAYLESRGIRTPDAEQG